LSFPKGRRLRAAQEEAVHAETPVAESAEVERLKPRVRHHRLNNRHAAVRRRTFRPIAAFR
jgi:hypothetical protein